MTRISVSRFGFKSRPASYKKKTERKNIAVRCREVAGPTHIYLVSLRAWFDFRPSLSPLSVCGNFTLRPFSFFGKQMFLVFPEKRGKVTVSVAVSTGRGLCRSRMGGTSSPWGSPTRLQLATFVVNNWHGSLTCHATNDFTTPSLTDGEERNLLRFVLPLKTHL